LDVLRVKGLEFNFEDTYLTDKIRIKKLVALLAIEFSWAHRTPEWQNDQKPIKIKKLGRPVISIFRYGLDFLRGHDRFFCHVLRD
jgi:hypothetical protein